jgi:hypothetical protein
MEPHKESLTEPEVQALLEALDDEYKAVATYEQVIDDFGPIRPFVNIIEAERRHVEALRGLFDRYNVEMPANPWPGTTPRYESVGEACAAGVEGEIENAAMYERLIDATHRTDIIEVFENLQRASRDNHLPAVRRCSRRGHDGHDHQAGHPRRRRRRGN